MYHVVVKKDERTRHSPTTLTVVGEREENIRKMLDKYKTYLFNKPGQRTTGHEDLRKKLKFVKWILRKTAKFKFRALSDTSSEDSSSDSDEAAEPPIEDQPGDEAAAEPPIEDQPGDEPAEPPIEDHQPIGAEPASPVIDDVAKGAAAATLNGDDSDDPIAQLSLQVGFW